MRFISATQELIVYLIKLETKTKQKENKFLGKYENLIES